MVGIRYCRYEGATSYTISLPESNCKLGVTDNILRCTPALIAQRIVRWFPKPKVAGSNPAKGAWLNLCKVTGFMDRWVTTKGHSWFRSGAIVEYVTQPDLCHTRVVKQVDKQ